MSPVAKKNITHKPAVYLAAFLLTFQALSLALFMMTRNRIARSTAPRDLNAYNDARGADPPEGYNTWIEFANKVGCSTNLSFYEQIYRDLKPWQQRGIPHAELDSIDLSGSNTWLVSYNSSTGTFVNYTNHWITNVPKILEPIQPIFRAHKNFHVVFNSHDEPRHIWEADFDRPRFDSVDELFAHSACFRDRYGARREMHASLSDPLTFVTSNRHAPIVSQCKLDCYEDIVLPFGHHQNIALTSVSDSYTWEQKKNVLFWRGATSGGKYGLQNDWMMYHRVRLMSWSVKYAAKYPGVSFETAAGVEPPAVPGHVSVDIGFHKHEEWNGHASTYKYLMERYGLKKEVSFQDTLRYKYLIVVDGYGWPNRLQNYLQGNSIILYNGIFTDYYNWMLKPWVHYVPVKPDFSDLEDLLDWLQANDDKAKAIGENARKLVKYVGSLSHQQCYTSLFLLEYARLYELGNSQVPVKPTVS
ncbi:glycosyl transferase family 90-domain-containing protein [Chytriomyces sp. MP71]|nr:glycosyl transferase family 90-domain-containing protein [Chytriomyces sp. MP71]